MGRHPARYDFSFRRNNLAGLMLACLVAWALLGLCATRQTPRDYLSRAASEHRVRVAEEKIDPNVATVASLRRLPGIGVELARRIVDFRAGKKRPFTTADDLAQVRGIGPAKAERAKPYISLPRGRE
ncbi:MAG: ComEA family DNA-binding protein [Planctomycetota bacterium]|jgi:competence ComEA-like helix-hairpin-helix protein